MKTATNTVEDLAKNEYRYGFVTDIESDSIPAGLNEDVIRVISAKKHEPEFMLEWRLKAYRYWAKLEKSQAEPKWANIHYPPIDYQKIIYYAAPKAKDDRPKSLEEVDPELLKTYEKLGIPLSEQELLAGVAVDAVFDSVSVATTFKAKLSELGIIFGSFSEAVQNHPDLVQKYLGSVVPYTDNFFAALNAAVFSDGSFCYIPKGVRCPMELSTYFRINAAETGQFERTLIVADEGSYVSYLEGCTAPMRDTNQLHAAVVELVAHDDAQIKYSTVQNWYPGDAEGQGRYLQLRHEARQVPRQTFEDFLDPGGDRFGDHLEVSELHSAGRRLRRRVLFGGADQQLSAGGYRHQDDPYRQEHQEHDHLQGDLRRARAKHLPRPGEDHEGRHGARNYSQCDSLLLGDKCGAHTFPYLEVLNNVAQVEHEASTSKIGEDQLFYCRQRGISTGRCRQHDRQRFLQAGVSRVADGVRGRGAETPGCESGGKCRLVSR